MKLAGLKLTAAQGAQEKTAEQRRREKLMLRLDEQLKLAIAAVRGEKYKAQKLRTVFDESTGVRTRVEVDKRVKQWWFAIDGGKLALAVRYGSAVLELARGKYSIEVRDIAEMADTIAVVREAVATGELDAQITAAATKLKKGFVK